MKIRFPRPSPQRSSPPDPCAEHVPWRQAIAAMERASETQARARLEARYGPAATWPRLSDTLTGPRHPHRCHSCGREQLAPQDEIAILEELHAGDPESIAAFTHLIEREASPAPGIYAWQEHGGDDQSEPIVVMLCTDCSDRLIEPHPRLYRRLARNEPCTGIMAVCLECAFREGVRCTCPEARINGGPGVQLEHDPPITGHLYYGLGRGGAFYTVYPHPVRSCSGRQPLLGKRAVP